MSKDSILDIGNSTDEQLWLDIEQNEYYRLNPENAELEKELEDFSSTDIISMETAKEIYDFLYR